MLEFDQSILNDLDPLRTIAVLGPTGSGKSDLALSIAQKYNGEIVNCDSVQSIKELVIGSAKPTKEEQALVPHHGYDLVSLGEEFDAGRYKIWAQAVTEDILARKRRAVVCGGTGLYFRALTGENFHQQLPDASPAIRLELSKFSLEEMRAKLLELDPERAEQLHPNDRVRHERAIEIAMITGKTLSQIQSENLEDDASLVAKPFTIVMDPPRDILLTRIEMRTEKMLQEGFIEEVETLLSVATQRQKAQLEKAVGYKEVVAYLEGPKHSHQDRINLKQAIFISTRQYAKRQKTWFQKVAADVRISSGF